MGGSGSGATPAAAPLAPGAPPAAGSFAIAGETRGPAARFAAELAAALEAAGLARAAGAAGAGVVLNVVDPERPRPFRRRSRGTFVAALWSRADLPADVEEGLRATYPMLVRTLSNISLCLVPGRGVLFTTMERGYYLVPESGGLAQAVVERLRPLATARLVIDNEFRPDLEPELRDGDELTREIGEAGRRLDRLGLLPAPFPIEELLGERELRHVARLYSIGGLSYGNLSARKDERRFWMSASGVDKASLAVPGRDILLVSGYDARAGRIVLSVPPGVEPRRVSVDAIEHWTIYRANPSVGAILHVHAWMEGIAATEVNYPCGTVELAEEVARLVAAAPDPGHAVVGLRNHGITATGESLAEILDRIEPRVLRRVPMT
ncbi:MAG TPA: class II aldolase/adducin family protein [Gaiellaceae bacterium]|nr:class II aldolase/adducin family protein [Gaiellaceae bacterium]